MLRAVEQDRFAGGPILRGTAPVIPIVTALPTAGVANERAIVVLDGVPQIAYVCLSDGAGAWAWVEVASG